MAIKMRYLYFSGKKKIAALGQHVKTKYELSINSVDVIPPAYSCDKERVVLIAVSHKGSELPDQLRLFLREMTKARAANTAVIIDGDQKAADAVVGYLREGGTNVVGSPLFFNGGNIFNSKLSDAEAQAADAWIDSIITSLA